MNASGPYCPVPQATEGYVHEVYPGSGGYVLILENGEVRPMTVDEVDALNAAFDGCLRASFAAPGPLP